MTSMDDAARARAQQRAAWPGGTTHLDADAPPDVSGLSPSERVAAVWSLTLDAWAMTGRPLPDYARAEAPGGLRRLRGPT